MKRTFVFILICAFPLLLATEKAFCQTETSKFDFYLKGNVGSLFNKNSQESRFNSEVTACFGAHLIAKYSFSKLGVSTGIGADRLKFAQKLVFSNNPSAGEYSTIEFSYLAWDIPILMHFSFTDRLEIFGGVNLIAASWMSSGISGVSNRTSVMTASSEGDIPSWQFTQEIMLGMNYKLTDRFDIGLGVAKSLRNLEGTRVDMELAVPGEDVVYVSEKFNYSWTRVNVEVAFRLNK